MTVEKYTNVITMCRYSLDELRGQIRDLHDETGDENAMKRQALERVIRAKHRETPIL